MTSYICATMPKIQLEVNARFKGHKDALFALVAGLNADTFLSSGGDGYVVAWNLDNPEEGKLLARVPHPVYSLLQPEPGSLLAGCSNGLIYHFNLDNNSLENTLQAHPNTGVFDLHLQQGKIYSFGGDGNLKIWSWPELQLERTIQISEKSLRQAQFSEQYLGVASSDHQIHLLDTVSLEEKQVLRGHTNSVFSLCFCPDGTLISGGRDALLKRWDLKTGTELQSLPAHWFPINQIVLSPDQQ